jgi:hypothetical protein
MPHLSQETIRFLDEADNGDPVSVRYLLTDRTETVSDGFLAGLPLDWEGNACIAVAGLHGGRVLIRMLDVISVTGTKQPAGRERP